MPPIRVIRLSKRLGERERGRERERGERGRGVREVWGYMIMCDLTTMIGSPTMNTATYAPNTCTDDINIYKKF